MCDEMQDEELDILLGKANAMMKALHHLVVVKHRKRSKTFNWYLSHPHSPLCLSSFG